MNQWGIGDEDGLVLTVVPSIGIIIADKNRLAGLFVMRTVAAPEGGLLVKLGWKRKLPRDPRSNAGIFMVIKKSPALERSCLNQALNLPASFVLAISPRYWEESR